MNLKKGKCILEKPDHCTYKGEQGEGAVIMELNWVDGFEINVHIEGDAAVISANREGVLSLANHMKRLAEEPPGSHIHLDVYNSLEDGSSELILQTIHTART